MYANPSPPTGRLWIAMSEGGVGTVIRHTLGNFTLLRGDGGLLEAASGLDSLAAATIGCIGSVDPLPAAAAIIGLLIAAVLGSIRIMQLRRTLKRNTPPDQRVGR